MHAVSRVIIDKLAPFAVKIVEWTKCEAYYLNLNVTKFDQLINSVNFELSKKFFFCAVLSAKLVRLVLDKNL